MTESPIDLFILAPPGRAAWLAATVESARQWLKPSPRRIIVVGQDSDAAWHEAARRLGITWIDGRAIMEFAPQDLPVLKVLPDEKREACFRQFLKWGLTSASGGSPYMAMDAGTILTAKRRVMEAGRYLLARERWFHFPDCRMHNWLFGMYPPPGGWFAPPAMVFDPAVVAEMRGLIVKRYKVRWFDAILNILNQVPQTRWCAAQAYGGYIENFHRDNMRAVPCSHQRLPAESFSIAGAHGAEIVSCGSDDPPPIATEKPVLRMSNLGVNGRFGNQIFQYALLRLLARERAMEAQNPVWIGASLFGHQERFSTAPLPLWSDQDGSIAEELAQSADSVRRSAAGAELWGYFQFHSSFYRNRQAEFRALFQPQAPFAAPLETAVRRLRAAGRTLVGIHLRRGDYSGGEFWPAPTSWYMRWLQEIWPTLDAPVLFVASDEPAKVTADFAAFAPQTAANLGVNLKGAEFYPDFFTLTRCDVLAISNSTFSFAAAMLNEQAQLFARPDPNLEGLVGFDPWNSPVLLSKSSAARVMAA